MLQPAVSEWQEAKVKVGRRIPLALVALGVALVASGVSEGAVTPPVGVVYAGDTRPQRNAVTIEVNAARNRVTKLVWVWGGPCALGPAATPATEAQTSWTEYRGGYPINRLGGWRRTFTTGPLIANGVYRTFRHAVVGRRSGGRMIGTLRSLLTDRDAAGQVIRTCDSGPLRFNVAERHVFSGLTRQRNPIIVAMNPARTRVARLRWDWDGTCTLGPGARPDTLPTTYVPDEIRTFPVDRLGRWGGTFSFDPQPDPDGTGISTAYAYRIVSRRVGQTMKGTITSSFTETDTASGAIIRICSSGPVKFNIRD
jgi:hypothetical protein